MANLHQEPNDSSTETFLKVAEVAKIFSVDKQTVRIWLRSGILRGVKIGDGHYWRVPMSEVRAFAQRKYGENDE